MGDFDPVAFAGGEGVEVAEGEAGLHELPGIEDGGGSVAVDKVVAVVDWSEGF